MRVSKQSRAYRSSSRTEPTTLRQTRTRSKLKDAAPLMRGLDHRGQALDPLSTDPEKISYTEVLQKLSKVRKIILRPSESPKIKSKKIIIRRAESPETKPVKLILRSTRSPETKPQSSDIEHDSSRTSTPDTTSQYPVDEEVINRVYGQMNDYPPDLTQVLEPQVAFKPINWGPKDESPLFVQSGGFKSNDYASTGEISPLSLPASSLNNDSESLDEASSRKRKRSDAPSPEIVKRVRFTPSTKNSCAEPESESVTAAFERIQSPSRFNSFGLTIKTEDLEPPTEWRTKDVYADTESSASSVMSYLSTIPELPEPPSVSETSTRGGQPGSGNAVPSQAMRLEEPAWHLYTSQNDPAVMAWEEEDVEHLWDQGMSPFGAASQPRPHWDWYEQYHRFGDDCTKVHGCNCECALKLRVCNECHIKWVEDWNVYFEAQERQTRSLAPAEGVSVDNVWKPRETGVEAPKGGSLRIHPKRKSAMYS